MSDKGKDKVVASVATRGPARRPRPSRPLDALADAINSRFPPGSRENQWLTTFYLSSSANGELTQADAEIHQDAGSSDGGDGELLPSASEAVDDREANLEHIAFAAYQRVSGTRDWPPPDILGRSVAKLREMRESEEGPSDEVEWLAGCIRRWLPDTAGRSDAYRDSNEREKERERKSADDDESTPVPRSDPGRRTRPDAPPAAEKVREIKKDLRPINWGDKELLRPSVNIQDVSRAAGLILNACDEAQGGLTAKHIAEEVGEAATSTHAGAIKQLLQGKGLIDTPNPTGVSTRAPQGPVEQAREIARSVNGQLSGAGSVRSRPVASIKADDEHIAALRRASELVRSILPLVSDKTRGRVRQYLAEAEQWLS
jgi:hypothetical protein